MNALPISGVLLSAALLCAATRTASAQELPPPPPPPPGAVTGSLPSSEALPPPPPSPWTMPGAVQPSPHATAAQPSTAPALPAGAPAAPVAWPPFVGAPGPAPYADGWWRPAESDEGSPPRSGTDPLLPVGVVMIVSGAVTSAIGVGVLVDGGAGQPMCGLSGCVSMPDTTAQNHGAAVIGIGAGVAAMGGIAALAGASGPPRHVRRSERRMATGAVFTSLGVGAAIGSLVEYIEPYTPVQPTYEYGSGYAYASNRDSNHVASAVMGVFGATFLAIGVPLWASGGRARKRPMADAHVAPEVLPSRGGAALRWNF